MSVREVGLPISSSEVIRTWIGRRGVRPSSRSAAKADSSRMMLAFMS